MKEKLKKLQELKEECVKCGISKDILVIWKDNSLFINSADTQSVNYKDGEYYFEGVTGSRFFWREKFTNSKDMAKFIADNIANKTSEDIDEIYQGIFESLKK